MFGFEDYQNDLIKNYPEKAFLTPSEIFKPYYGHAMAKLVLQHNEEDEINVIEVGSGTGVFADSFLDYIKYKDNQKYKNIQYKLVEISKPLLKSA